MPDESVNSDVVPLRAVLIIDVAAPVDEAQDLINDLVIDIEGKGLFCHYVTMSELALDDVAEGSPLHEALTGEPAT